jgi:hypothetical protein
VEIPVGVSEEFIAKVNKEVEDHRRWCPIDGCETFDPDVYIRNRIRNQLTPAVVQGGFLLSHRPELSSP